MTAILTEISIFWVTAICMIRSMSYGSKHASQPPSNKPFVHTYMHNLKTTGYNIWTCTFCISNNCSTIEDIPCTVYNCMRDLTGGLWPQTHQLFSNTTLCVYILQTRTYITIWRTATHDNKTHIRDDCILHTK